MPIHQSPKVPRVPELVGATNAPFVLTSAPTNVSLALQEPTGPARLDIDEVSNLLPKRIFLNIENIISSEWSAPYDVYLNLPPNEQPEKHPELYAGPLPMFGLREASRADGKHPPDGLFEQLDITKQYAYLAALPGWDAKSLRVSFVPRNREAKANLKVGRVSLYFA